MPYTDLSAIGQLVYAGIDEVFSTATKVPRKLFYKQIVREKTQKKKYGWYDTIGALGPAELHTEDKPITYDKIEYDSRTTIETLVYDKGVKGTLESIEFDLENVVQTQFGSPLVRVMTQKKERVVAAVYNGVFTTVGADLAYQASATHPLKNSSKVNVNLLTGEMSPETIKKAKNLFNDIYDQAGEFYDTEPTHLLIHPNKLYLALMLLNSNLMALELTNNKNVIQDVMPIKVITNKYLTYDITADTAPWFMLDKPLMSEGDGAGCILQKTGGLQLKTFWDWDNLTYKGIAYEMYAAGMVAPGYGFVASLGT
jgi:hypothetical protein